MEPNITEEMTEEFNAILEEKGTLVRLKWNFGGVVYITLPEDQFIDRHGLSYCQVSVTMQFYVELQAFFRDKGIVNLHYNNTGNVFWSEGVVN